MLYCSMSPCSPASCAMAMSSWGEEVPTMKRSPALAPSCLLTVATITLGLV